MTGLRLLRVVLHLFEGLFTAALFFPFMGEAAKSRRKQRWSAALVKHCGVQVRYREAPGAAIPPRALLVANHISWLDIFVMNSVLPSHFVAKSDIRGWPLIGWLCDKAGTVFIARGRVRDVRRIFEHLVELLEQGQHVAFFPEGTTAAQGQLLPFHANLFEAAIDAKVPVQPFALRYLDKAGKLHPAADFIGEMTFAQSMFVVLRSGGMVAELTLLPSLSTEGTHRRELAEATREVIAAELGGALGGLQPDRRVG